MMRMFRGFAAGRRGSKSHWLKAYWRKPLNMMAHPTRFERVTFAFGGQRSIQLSYGCSTIDLADCLGLGNGPIGDRKRRKSAFSFVLTRFLDANRGPIRAKTL
jgi:hypothetical protein